MVSNVHTIHVTPELGEQLLQRAKSLGMDVPGYLSHLVNGPQSRIDAKAAEAARFMISKHEASLRKLAQ